MGNYLLEMRLMLISMFAAMEQFIWERRLAGKDYNASSVIIYMQTGATGFDRSFWRPTDAMPGYSMQLVKKRREKTIANSNELALAA
jgi:hypothetical protein